MIETQSKGWYNPLDRAMIGALSTLEAGHRTNGFRLSIWACAVVLVKTDEALLRSIGRMIGAGIIAGNLHSLCLASHAPGVAWRVIEHTEGFKCGFESALRIGTSRPGNSAVLIGGPECPA